jgi:hypothetical protein
MKQTNVPEQTTSSSKVSWSKPAKRRQQSGGLNTLYANTHSSCSIRDGITKFIKQTNILERAIPSNKSEMDLPEPEYALSVALVYQDAPTKVWASQVCDQVAQLVGKDSIHSAWWEVSRLSDPKVLTDAVLTAMQADVILVSIYDVQELPVELCVWIDAWLPRRYMPMGALITLISVPEQPGTLFDHAREYLREVAQKGRMDFLLRERRLPVESRGFLYTEKAVERINAMAPMLQEALSYDHNRQAVLGMNL